MRRILLVLAAALAGCTLYDGRPSIELDPAVIPPAAGPFQVTVRGRGDGRAQIFLDDAKYGPSVQLGVPTWIETIGLNDGTHRLRARLDGVPYPIESPERTFVLDRASPVVSAEPPCGPTASRVPLVATIHAEDGLTGVAELTVELNTSLAGDAAAKITRVDSRTFRVEASGTLDEVKGVFVNVRVTDGAGNRREGLAGWTAPYFPSGGFDSFSSPSPFRGVVQIGGTLSSGGGPSVVDLFAGGVRVAGAPNAGSRWAVSWDTTNVPDGTYLLELGSVGWYPRVPGPTVVVDNTPPIFEGCTLPAGFGDAMSIYAGVAPAANEPLTWAGVAPEMRIDGAVVRAWWALTGDGLQWYHDVTGIHVPAVLDVLFPEGSMTDAAGNPMPAGRCTIPLPEWVMPDGPGAMSYGGVTLEAAAATVDVEDATLGGPRPEFVAWIPPTGADGAGEMRRYGVAVNVEPGSTASDPHLGRWYKLAWIERTAAGSGHVYFSPGLFQSSIGPLNADPSRDGRDLAMTPGGAEIAWSEDTPQGGRNIWVSIGGSVAIGPVIDDPTTVAESLAIADYLRVAYVERASSGAQLLRVRAYRTDGSGIWDLLGVVPLNRDVTRAASEPAILAPAGTTVVAWTEAGQVLAREWNGSIWSDPVVLNADAARPARSPRLLGGSYSNPVWLVFVQDTASGEQIRARRFEGGAWRLIDPPVNAGVPGPVVSLSTNGGQPLSVVWTDLAGHVYLRSYNE